MTQGVGGWVSPFVLRGSGKTSWHWGFSMDGGDDQSFCDFLGIANHDDHELPGVSTPNGLEEQPESEKPGLDPSVLSPSVIDEVVPLNNGRDSSSSTTFDIDKQVRIALQSQRVAVPKHLWETGVWQLIFTNQNPADSFSVFGQELHRPSIFPGPVAATDDVEPSSKKARSKHRFDQVVRFKPDLTWKEQTDAALQSSVKLWYMLIGRWKRESAMYIELHEFRWEGDALTMLLDIFASRSPYTLRKRALALMHVCDYLELHWCPAFPIRERDMYAFLCHERESGAPSSRLKGYMQSINFCRFVLDLKELDEVVNSARCRGTTKPKSVVERNQTSPLKVEEVQLLHSNLTNGSELWDRMFSGAALFCLYARARWGDLMRAEKVLIDRDNSGVACYLEARVGSHKTMQSQQHRHQFLPMVATAKGLVESNWIEQWLEVRNCLSLDFSRDGVMPAPQPDGQPGSRPLDSQEAAGWLRLILFGDALPVEGRKVASHSLKTTTLSYAAKRGLDINLRLQLRYHTQPFRMGLTYSRDGAAASISALEQLLCEVRLGLFLPDETRSGRVMQQATAQSSNPIVIKDEEEPGAVATSVTNQSVFPGANIIDSNPPNLEGTSSSESDSTSGSEMEETTFEPFAAPGKFQPPSAPEGFHMWQHKKSRILHLMEDQNNLVFTCGRSVGPFHTKEGLHPRYDTPICWSCFNKARQ